MSEVVTEIGEPTPPSKETAPNNALRITVTHHLADAESYPEGTNPESLLNKAKALGAEVIRSDARWKTVIPEPGHVNHEYLDRFTQYAKLAETLGMENTVVLSTPPKRAIENPVTALAEYRVYLEELKAALERQGVKVTKFQIFNELNTAFTPKPFIEKLPDYCQAVRAVFGKVELSATLVTGNLSATLGDRASFLGFESFESFLQNHPKAFEGTDTIGIDFYPGWYDFSFKEAGIDLKKDLLKKRDSLFRDLPKQLDHLKQSVILAAKTGKKIEIGEVGFPIIAEKWQAKFGVFDERFQRWAYDNFARAFVRMIRELREEHQISISGLGLYQLGNEREMGPVKFGLYRDQEKARGVTGGHAKKDRQDTQTEAQNSQLAFIIRYLKTDLKPFSS